MKRNVAVILGGSSYIAHEVLHQLNLGVDKVIFIVRKQSKKSLPKLSIPAKILTIEDFNKPSLSESQTVFESEVSSSSILLINFTGTLGELNNQTIFSFTDFHNTYQENMNPFIYSVELLKRAKEGSLCITFSGAGVGGNGIDGVSYGYLCAKASIGFMVEVLQREFQDQNKHICAVAPGPFPSLMQTTLINPNLQSKIPDTKIKEIKKLINSGGSNLKLISSINAAIKNADKVGGRLISAKFDDIEGICKDSNFGKLRRVTN